TAAGCSATSSSAWAAAAASCRCVAVQVAAGCRRASVHEQQQEAAVHVLQCMSSSSSSAWTAAAGCRCVAVQSCNSNQHQQMVRKVKWRAASFMRVAKLSGSLRQTCVRLRPRTVASVSTSPHCPGPTSVYVHLPFCKRKCFYCDFPVEAVGARNTSAAQQRITDYVQTLRHEIAAMPVLNSMPLQTIFFGGGVRLGAAAPLWHIHIHRFIPYSSSASSQCKPTAST
ncbi:elp3 domain-containing protein, partial [Haematococcus lacustris]